MINPRIIDSITGLSTYNAGINGGRLFEFSMVFNGYLLHHPAPKMLVLTLDPWSFELNKEMMDYSQFFPFIGRNKFVAENLSGIGKGTALRYLPFLDFIYMDDNIKTNALRGLAGRTEMKSWQFDYKGYLSTRPQCLDSITVWPGDTLLNPKMEASEIAKLQAMIETCRKKNIEMIITYAPEYRHRYQEKYLNFSKFILFVDDLTKKNGIPFYRDDNLSLGQNPCLFVNNGHTNVQGAIEYSQILGHRIRDLLTAN